MRTIASIALAALTAFSAAGITSTDAQAHRYRNNGGAIALGVATAVIAGIALSRHHRHHRYYSYYSYYDDGYYGDDYYYARPRYYRSYSYGYYPRSLSYAYGNIGHHRGFNPAYPHINGGHHRHH